MQPEPPVGPKRVRICEWEPCAELQIPQDWLSGVYLGKLTALASGLESYVVFIVRDDRRADYLFQCSDNTWQAYNRWPNQFSLYDNGQHEWYWGGGVQVSFRRPYGKYCQILDAPLSLGSGEWLLWEFPLAYWMESAGYDVTYISNLDTHRDPEGLRRARGFLSVGHDEYWTIEMFENVRAAIASGVNVAFLSGNAVCGRIQFDDASQAFERVGVFGPPGGTHEFEQMSTLEHRVPTPTSSWVHIAPALLRAVLTGRVECRITGCLRALACRPAIRYLVWWVGNIMATRLPSPACKLWPAAPRNGHRASRMAERIRLPSIPVQRTISSSMRPRSGGQTA